MGEWLNSKRLLGRCTPNINVFLKFFGVIKEDCEAKKIFQKTLILAYKLIMQRRVKAFTSELMYFPIFWATTDNFKRVVHPLTPYAVSCMHCVKHPSPHGAKQCPLRTRRRQSGKAKGRRRRPMTFARWAPMNRPMGRRRSLALWPHSILVAKQRTPLSMI